MNSRFSFQNIHCAPTKGFYWYSASTALPAEAASPTYSSVQHHPHLLCLLIVGLGSTSLEQSKQLSLILSLIKTHKSHQSHIKVRVFIVHWENSLKALFTAGINHLGGREGGNKCQETCSNSLLWSSKARKLCRGNWAHSIHSRSYLHKQIACTSGAQHIHCRHPELPDCFRTHGSPRMIKPVHSEQNTVYSGSEYRADHSIKSIQTLRALGVPRLVLLHGFASTETNSLVWERLQPLCLPWMARAIPVRLITQLNLRFLSLHRF